MNVLDVNGVNLRNVYSTAAGNRLGVAGTSGNQTGFGNFGVQGATPSANDVPTNNEVANAVSVGGQASPAIGALVFIALIVGLSFLAKRIGEETEFRNVRVSPFNVLIISLAAIIGVPVWKYIFTKLPVPGVSTWVQSV